MPVRLSGMRTEKSPRLNCAQRFQQLAAVEHHLEACVHGFHGSSPAWF